MFFLRLFHEVDLLNRLLDRGGEIIHINRLGSEVERPSVHRCADILHIPVGGHHDALLCRITQFVDFRKQGQSIHLRHIDVAQHNVKIWMFHHQLQRF